MQSLNDLRDAFSGKRVLVTGHTGFKGTWLAFMLSKLGANVTGLGLDPAHSPNNFSLLGLKDKINNRIGDIRDLSFVTSEIHKAQPEYIFHLAAQALVKESYTDPVNTFATNVLGSVNVLESVRHCSSVRSLIYVTSDKCYENKEWVWGYRESDTLGGHDPYSASKAAAEIIFSSYAASFFNEREQLGAASVRAGNVIGGGDWSPNRIVPDCIRAYSQERPIVLRNPSATRPWQHVLEPLSGYLMLACKLYTEPKKWAGAWNFGPSSTETRTVAQVVDELFRNMERQSMTVVNNAHTHHEARLLQLNCDKATQLLGWHPRWNIAQTIKATANWYSAVSNGASVQDVTWNQIENYYEKKTND